MIVTAFSVYSASKDKPMQTSKLLVSLILALVCFGVIQFGREKIQQSRPEMKGVYKISRF